jgi:hypothetical protein
MKNAFLKFGKSAAILSAIFIAVLLISTATAVPQTHGSVAIKKVREVKQVEKFSKGLSKLINGEDKSYLQSLFDRDLLKKTRTNIYSLIQKLKDISNDNVKAHEITKNERIKLASIILTFVEQLIKNANNLKSSRIFDNIKEEIAQVSKQNNINERDIIARVQSLLEHVLGSVNGSLKESDKGNERSILKTLRSDIMQIIHILNNFKVMKETTIKNSIENVLSHYTSEMFSKIKQLGDGNWTKIIIIIILAIVSLLLIIGILIWLWPFLIPVIQLFMMALTPLVGLLAIAVTIGAIIGLSLIILGIIVLLMAFIVGLNLAIAVIFAIIILIVIALIVISIALTALGLFVAGLGLIIGGLIAASPVILPILLGILSIVVVVNFILRGAILSGIYGLIEKIFPSLAEAIKSVCETLYNIPVIGPIFAFILPGLPWPQTEYKRPLLRYNIALTNFLLGNMFKNGETAGAFATL